MKKIIFVLLLILTGLLSAEEWQDVLYIKDSKARLLYGPIVKGKIVEQIPDSSITILIQGGVKLTYLISDIEKITSELIEKPIERQPIEPISKEAQRSIWDEPNPAKKDYEDEINSYRDPTTACLLSFLIPGVGQMYNGEGGKGVGFLFLAASGYILAFTVGIEEEDIGYGVKVKSTNSMYGVGLFIGISTQIWSIIDAPQSANRINRERGFKKVHILPDKNGLKLILVYNF